MSSDNIVNLASRRPKPKEPPTDRASVRDLCRRLARMSSVKSVHDCARENIATPAAEVCNQVLGATTLPDIRELLEDYLEESKEGTGTIEYCEISHAGKYQYAFRLVQPGLTPTCETKSSTYEQGLAQVKALAQRSRMMMDWDTVGTKRVTSWGIHNIITRADEVAQLREQQRNPDHRWSLFSRQQPTSC